MMRQRGFTLIELLVAITIMAVVAVLGWRGLDSIVRARVTLTRDLEQSRGLQLAFSQIQNDCRQVAGPDSIGNRVAMTADEGMLTIVRTVNVENQPSAVQVVAYRLIQGTLVRRESPVTRDLGQLDQYLQTITTEADKSQVVKLQGDIARMSLRTWLASANMWIASGSTGGATSTTGTTGASGVPAVSGAMLGGAGPVPGGQPAGAPLAAKGLEVTLQMRDSGSAMVKIFLLGAV
jgi:general secretion pathway protein J